MAPGKTGRSPAGNTVGLFYLISVHHFAHYSNTRNLCERADGQAAPFIFQFVALADCLVDFSTERHCTAYIKMLGVPRYLTISAFLTGGPKKLSYDLMQNNHIRTHKVRSELGKCHKIIIRHRAIRCNGAAHPQNSLTAYQSGALR